MTLVARSPLNMMSLIRSATAFLCRLRYTIKRMLPKWITTICTTGRMLRIFGIEAKMIVEDEGQEQSILTSTVFRWD